MEQRLTIIGLGVDDLKISTQFYEEKFGWTKLPTSNDNITFFQLNGIQLSLYPREKLAEDATVNAEGNGFKTFSLAFNTRSENEVDKLINSLESKGVKIIKRPEKVFWGGYSSYIADPDNNLWEIAFNPFLPIDENGNF
tara:strand:+ start:22445 stop:22861 length:417 start_codon:yes stop_codon:yes gene_type:complete